MASPRVIQRINDELIDLTFDAYMAGVRDLILEEETADLDTVVQRTARAILVARLEGIVYATRPARQAGVTFTFDDPDEIEFTADDEQFRNMTGDMLATFSEKFAKDDLKLIKGAHIEKIAKAFASSVPEIKRRILLEAQLSGSLARQIWAAESVAIFEVLKPVITTQLEETGIGLRSFFFDGQRATMRQQFGEVARARLENIYRTNLSTASNEAVWKETHEGEVFDIVEFFEYVAVDDGRVRPHHWAFDGVVQRKDWEGWKVIWPPNGYQCRCAAPTTIFPTAAKRRGFLSSDGKLVQAAIARTWANAVSAGLMTPAGQLTYPRVVSMRDRDGNQRDDAFPQVGFGG